MKVSLTAAVFLAVAAPAAAAQPLEFTPREVRAILRHGPWPAAWRPDPSNRASGNPQAIALGENLFFDPRLSGRGNVLCASCHEPYRDWQDGRARAFGQVEVDRNTPSVLDVRWNRWFGWDGAGDSLWAQSLRPILDSREMAGSASHAAALVRNDPDYRCRFEAAFGAPPPADDEAALVAIGKALAAFQETLISGRSPFDDFRDALERRDFERAARYPPAARRGLRIFIGKGSCDTCHVGPAFTDGEFHDIGIAHLNRGEADPGRYGGIQRLRASPFNLLGRYNDDPSGESAIKTKHVALDDRNLGEFRVPSLRNVALTAPYMHDGSLATLRDVVRHYSELPERLPSGGESILKPLRLDEREIADLVAFLESLSETRSAVPPRRPEARCVR